MKPSLPLMAIPPWRNGNVSIYAVWWNPTPTVPPCPSGVTCFLSFVKLWHNLPENILQYILCMINEKTNVCSVPPLVFSEGDRIQHGRWRRLAAVIFSLQYLQRLRFLCLLAMVWKTINYFWSSVLFLWFLSWIRWIVYFIESAHVL